MREQISQIEILEGELPAAELLFPVRRRAKVLPGPMAAQTIVGGALLRILERLVGFADFLESFLGAGLLGNVRMVLSREFPVRLLDLLGARFAVDAHHRVVVFVFHVVLRGGRVVLQGAMMHAGRRMSTSAAATDGPMTGKLAGESSSIARI